MPRALGFVLAAVFIDTVGFGIVYPPMPKLIMELTGEGLSAAAGYAGGLMFVFALMQFFAAPVLGNLSDRFGRRPVLLLSLAGFGIDYAVMGFAPDLTWLFVGRAIAGVCGATYATANAYITDVTPPDDRAKRFGLVGAAWGVGFIVGPALGGVLGEIGPRVPFFAAASLALANVLYGYFVLPESLKESDRRPFSLARANPVGSIRQMSRYPIVIGLMGALFFYQIAHDANPATWNFYTMEKFQWTSGDIGWSMAVIGASFALVQMLMIGPIIARLGERRTAYAGFSLYVIAFILLAFAPAGWVVYAAIVPFAFGTIANPAIRSIMSRAIPANAQGELQGALGSMQSLTAIGAPVLMTQLFRYYTRVGAPIHFPGAPFLAAGLLTLAALVVCLLVLRGFDR
ncbi:MAG TPA: TCR/Tet family MFS transporter [Steroidobacteraceae bacterium]|nr:TCR/Tet family MFS transporter [Steroidobacteraceae bacterium]